MKHNHASNWKEKRQSPTYNSWRGMIQRCTNPKHKHFTTYYDKLYAPWKSFEVFLKDMGTRPPGTTLDRVDNSKGYSPENCRWATATEQQRNKPTVKLTPELANTISVFYRRDGFTIKELANIFNVSESTVKNVLYRGDWL